MTTTAVDPDAMDLSDTGPIQPQPQKVSRSFGLPQVPPAPAPVPAPAPAPAPTPVPTPTLLSYSEFNRLVTDPSNPYTGGFYALVKGVILNRYTPKEVYLGRYQPGKDRVDAGGTTTLCFEKQRVIIENDLKDPKNNTKIFKTGEPPVTETTTPAPAPEPAPAPPRSAFQKPTKWQLLTRKRTPSTDNSKTETTTASDNSKTETTTASDTFIMNNPKKSKTKTPPPPQTGKEVIGSTNPKSTWTQRFGFSKGGRKTRRRNNKKKSTRRRKH